MEIKYDTPIEVTPHQYRVLMNDARGSCAGKKEDGKFFIKVWAMEYIGQIKEFLNSIT